MKPVLAIVMMILFTGVFFHNLTDLECGPDEAAACCVCLCHVPAIKPSLTSTGTGPSLKKDSIANADALVFVRLFDKRAFRPPRTTA